MAPDARAMLFLTQRLDNKMKFALIALLDSDAEAFKTRKLTKQYSVGPPNPRPKIRLVSEILSHKRQEAKLHQHGLVYSGKR